MSAYMVFNYTVTNPEGYQGYPAAVGATFAPYGAEVLFVDVRSEPVEGTPGHITVVVRFESKEAARAWYESPEYQAALPIRTANTEGVAVLCEAL
jgi:uncharacterized protein (DUF1330 family)